MFLCNLANSQRDKNWIAPLGWWRLIKYLCFYNNCWAFLNGPHRSDVFVYSCHYHGHIEVLFFYYIRLCVLRWVLNVQVYSLAFCSLGSMQLTCQHVHQLNLKLALFNYTNLLTSAKCKLCLLIYIFSAFSSIWLI